MCVQRSEQENITMLHQNCHPLHRLHHHHHQRRYYGGAEQHSPAHLGDSTARATGEKKEKKKEKRKAQVEKVKVQEVVLSSSSFGVA